MQYTKNVKYILNLRYLLGAILFRMWVLVPDYFLKILLHLYNNINKNFYKLLIFTTINKVFCDFCPAHVSFTNKLLSLSLVVKNYLMPLMYTFVGINTSKILIRNCILREVLKFSSPLKHFTFLQGQNNFLREELAQARFLVLNLFVKFEDTIPKLCKI